MATAHNQKALHFIGIGGSGMCPLAEIALEQGFQVSGSDTKASQATVYLQSLGAAIDLSQSGTLLRAGQRIVVSSAIQQENAEISHSKELGLEVLHRSALLKELMHGRKPITVAGTHGKTTTTAMIAFMLQELGQRPSAAIGGAFVGKEHHALIGDGPWFVAELDESDGTHLLQTPAIAVLTNVEKDHLDFYLDEAAVANSFAQYLSNTGPGGKTVICWDNLGSRTIGLQYQRERLSYGFHQDADVRVLDYAIALGHTHFQVQIGERVLPIDLPMLGKHNILNATAALAVAHILNLDLETAAKALGQYPGIRRRLSQHYSSQNVQVYDDYAHNPGKMAACLEGVKEWWPHFKIHAIYQAHRYSRLETMYAETIAAFRAADHVTVLPIYAAGETPSRTHSTAALAAAIASASNCAASTCESLEDCAQDLVDSLGGPTIFITLGAGDVWKVSHHLKALLDAQKTQLRQ